MRCGRAGAAHSTVQCVSSRYVINNKARMYMHQQKAPRLPLGYLEQGRLDEYVATARDTYTIRYR